MCSIYSFGILALFYSRTWGPDEQKCMPNLLTSRFLEQDKLKEDRTQTLRFQA